MGIGTTVQGLSSGNHEEAELSELPAPEILARLVPYLDMW